MLIIRLQRIGKKHQPSYRVVVAERRSKLIAPPREDLGSYSTTSKKANLNAERVNYWMEVGAQPTPTVHNLLVKEKIISAPKKRIHMAKAQAKAAEPEPTVEPAVVPAETEAPAESTPENTEEAAA